MVYQTTTLETNGSDRWVSFKGKKTGLVSTKESGAKVYITERDRLFTHETDSGFSISRDIFSMLKLMSVSYIRIVLKKYDGCTAVYETTIDKWLDKGKLNYYGTEPQLFLAVNDFETKTG